MIYQPWAFRMLGIAGAPDIVVPQAGVNITNIATKLMNFTMLDNALLDFTLLVNDIEWFILWTLNDRPISLSSQPFTLSIRWMFLASQHRSCRRSVTLGEISPTFLPKLNADPSIFPKIWALLNLLTYMHFTKTDDGKTQVASALALLRASTFQAASVKAASRKLARRAIVWLISAGSCGDCHKLLEYLICRGRTITNPPLAGEWTLETESLNDSDFPVQVFIRKIWGLLRHTKYNPRLIFQFFSEQVVKQYETT